MKMNFFVTLIVFAIVVQLMPLMPTANASNQQFAPITKADYLSRAIIGVPRVSAPGADGKVDVTVEIAIVKEEVARNGVKEVVSSGAYDLRLFRDGQLVGSSAPKELLEEYIRRAPAAVEKDRQAFERDPQNSLLNTEEDKLWREHNDLAKVVKFDTEGKGSYTFKNIQLPRDGRKEVEFSAYAFNADRVKSDTARTKYVLPDSITSQPIKKGRAFLISIGVNASENPAYNLLYAANDARKMQEIIGERLKAERAKYSEVIQIPLVSDYDKNKTVTENTAQKAIIKGVFSLLSGKVREVPENVLKQIPNRDQIKAVEPEDTLIVTFSGHGYADQSGIFYLLPYDIGRDTIKLTTETLSKLISSDELSLWMQDITAFEMMMIIDACHSSAAVQGDGFKPGPMGSRGLGQLAYDKDMKILSATQADNVALELGSLQMGLLSYALLQDGIIQKLADADKNKQLFSTEWLSFAEKRVPELYQDVKDGKRGIIIDGKQVTIVGRDTEIINLDGNQKSSLNLQEPHLFDFKRRKEAQILLTLPQ